MPVKGIERVRKNYRIKVKELSTKRTYSAIYAILSQGGALAATMTPVDTSTLINSQYSPQITGSERKMSGHIGYTAEYALWVHQAPGKLKGEPRADFGMTREGVAFGGGTGNGRYWDPNAEPGFLVKGFEELKPSIPDLLEKIYRV